MGVAPHCDWTIPLGQPFYPPLPAYYRNVKMHYVFFRTDPAGVAPLLPDPLVAAEDGVCAALGIDVPYCSNYGSFQEVCIAERCTFGDQVGWYISHVFHNGPAGIAAGREIYGTAKFYAMVNTEQTGRMMVTEGLMGTMAAVRVETTMAAPCSPQEIPDMTPAWRLKWIPRADGPGPAIKQLIDGAPALRDLQIHTCHKGQGTVRFDASSLCDLTALSPKESLQSFYVEASYTETYAKIVYDFLAVQNG